GIMSPIFHVIIPDEEAKSVIKRKQTAQVPLQVIPEAEDKELNLNLKLNTSRSRPRRSLCKQPSKIEHPSPSHATLSISRSSPSPAPTGASYRHRHSVCPPSTTVHLSSSTTHVYASWNHLSVSRPTQPSSENEFQPDLLFNTSAVAALQFGKKSEKPDPDYLVQKCRRILTEDFKRAFPDGKVPDPFILPKGECMYAA
ncbi:hypothetical protein BGY98DRAFT_1005832, partial [Russula aff. rugulosa BPL654]